MKIYVNSLDLISFKGKSLYIHISLPCACMHKHMHIRKAGLSLHLTGKVEYYFIQPWARFWEGSWITMVPQDTQGSAKTTTAWPFEKDNSLFSSVWQSQHAAKPWIGLSLLQLFSKCLQHTHTWIICPSILICHAALLVMAKKTALLHHHPLEKTPHSQGRAGAGL